jgi:plasmid maintenance system antidote protein VapI
MVKSKTLLQVLNLNFLIFLSSFAFGLLQISEIALSKIINSKHKINLALAKQLYKKLGIAPEYILEFA